MLSGTQWHCQEPAEHVGHLPTAAIFVSFAYLRNFRSNSEKDQDLQTLPGRAQTRLGLSFILQVMFKMGSARGALSVFLHIVLPSSCHFWLESGWAELDLSIVKHILLSALISREKEKEDKKYTQQSCHHQKTPTKTHQPSIYGVA